MQGVYWYRNKINDKRYIGSTRDFEVRWAYHEWKLENNKHENRYLQKAWNKHSKANFVWEIVEKVEDDREAALNREQYYLDLWWDTGLLYNISRKANCICFEDGHLPAEHRANISEALMGHEVTQETRDKLSESHKGQVSGMKGKSHTEETKQGHSEFMKDWHNENENPFKNKHHTIEAKQEIGRAQLGNENNARTYPAFYNEQTNSYVPAGMNFTKMCREYGFDYDKFYTIKSGRNKRTRDGWRLAMPEEIQMATGLSAGAHEV